MQAKRFEALDGWRGIAALAVAFYHAPVAHAMHGAANWKNMEIFVDFFFVLSGFVIMFAWGRRLDGIEAAKDFMTRRFWRIWPLHFVILAAFLALEFVKLGLQQFVTLPLDGAPFTEGRSWASLLTNIVMVQSLNLHGTTTWNGAAWSISVEFWTYFVFAGVMMAFRRHLDLALAVMAALGAVVLMKFSQIYLFSTHDFGLPRAIYGFFVGASVCRLVVSGRVRIEAKSGIELAALVGLAGYILATGMNPSSYLAPLVFGAVILVFSQGQGILTQMLESRPIQALGRWSYSIYLVHGILFYGLSVVLVAAQKALKLPLAITGTGAQRLFSFGGGLADGALMLAMLGATVALAALTYCYIEKPYMVSSSAPRPQVLDGALA